MQEIQLELIRRHQFNAFDGRKIAASLRQHRSLWEAVLMDFGDVVSLIRENHLDESFQQRLAQSIRADFIECLEEVRREDEYEARQDQSLP